MDLYDIDDGLSSLVRDRWIRIMCDYSADGVWAKNGGSASAYELPVDLWLIARIRGWQAWYERFDCMSVEPPADIEAFALEGLAIARAVKAALPEWTIIYFDEAQWYQGERRPGRPRSEYEYAITRDQ